MADVADELVVLLLAPPMLVVEEIVIEPTVNQDSFFESSLHLVLDLVGRLHSPRNGIQISPPIPGRVFTPRSAKGHDDLLRVAGKRNSFLKK